MLDVDLDNILLMALRKEPQRRYGSVEQLANDLRNHLTGMPVRARGKVCIDGGVIDNRLQFHLGNEVHLHVRAIVTGRHGGASPAIADVDVAGG